MPGIDVKVLHLGPRLVGDAREINRIKSLPDALAGFPPYSPLSLAPIPYSASLLRSLHPLRPVAFHPPGENPRFSYATLLPIAEPPPPPRRLSDTFPSRSPFMYDSIRAPMYLRRRLSMIINMTPNRLSPRFTRGPPLRTPSYGNCQKNHKRRIVRSQVSTCSDLRSNLGSDLLSANLSFHVNSKLSADSSSNSVSSLLL